MPRIPTYTSQISAMSLRSSGRGIDTRVNPDAFGAGIADAMQQSAQAVSKVARTVGGYAQEQIAQKRKEDLVNFMAQTDYTQRANDILNSMGPDGAGYHEAIMKDYRSYVDESVNGIQDNATRREARMRLLADMPDLSVRAARQEIAMRGDYSKLQADTSLNALQNKISIDPTQYDTYVKQGADVIDSRPGIPSSLKEGMKQSWRYDAANRRFEGMLRTAKTKSDFNNIAEELAGRTGRDWSKEFLPSQYEQAMNTLGNAIKAYDSRVNTDARAALSDAESRSDKLSLLPSEDLMAVQATVKDSSNPELARRMSRLMRDQHIIREGRRLPPSELKSRIISAKGAPGAAYPGVPPEVSSAINEAAPAFGVSAGFLGTVANKEYGQNFKVNRMPVESKFKPIALDTSIDVKSLRSDIAYGAAVAGEEFGSPLSLVKGRDNGDTGINVATVGMSGEQKAKLAASLAEAGFTGFSEYEGYMRADVRRSVPASFGTEKDGKTWGGWTNLSPEVVRVLKEKGFTAGADASTIKRSQKISSIPNIDYTKGTSIVDEKGRPTSSAVGLFQFTNKTWLDLVKDPAVAAVMGEYTNGKNDGEILALRGDPRLSTLAAAAYAAKNKKIMRSALGRDISDAELYMAHFLGPGAALNFISANENNPSQSAAAILPSAAKANKPVFYSKGKENTVGEVYANIARQFNLEPSRVQFEDSQLWEKMLATTETELKRDPMQHAIQSGSHTVAPLDQDGGFAARGATARAVADYNNIPMSEMKPFTEEEASWIKSQIDDADPDKSIGIFSEIQSMGSEPAAAAMRQIGVKDEVFAHAGDLYLQGSPSVASDIIRGRKLIQENPSVKDQIGKDSAINSAFTSEVGGALFDIEPARQRAIQESAVAYYAQNAIRKSGSVKFNKEDFSKSVQAVLGGEKGFEAVADVNGEKTFMPKGVTPDLMEDALRSMTIEDYTRLSVTGDPPRYADGSVVDPRDIRDEVMLRYIGNNRYRMMLDDGSVLLTGAVSPDGRRQAYIFQPDAKALSDIVSRPQTVAVNSAGAVAK